MQRATLKRSKRLVACAADTLSDVIHNLAERPVQGPGAARLWVTLRPRGFVLLVNWIVGLILSLVGTLRDGHGLNVAYPMKGATRSLGPSRNACAEV